MFEMATLISAEGLDNPALTVALALIVGILAQSLGRHIHVPGIVLLLAAGVILGPDPGFNIVRPGLLGDGLHLLVGFAVAVILFEGGLNLEWKRLRRAQLPIQLLITVGSLITAAGAALAAALFLEWSPRNCILFGTLVIVTGPTVITPLLRRLKVQRSVSTILEAEGVLIDAVGAVIAVVALEVALAWEDNPGAAWQAGRFFTTMGFGILVGLVGGLLLAILLRRRRIVPEGLENVFALALILALFQICNATPFEESGIAAVTVAGIVLGNSRTPVRRDLMEFKEQLTVMLIGMLFVLLAADVRLGDLKDLLPGAIGVIAALMFVVRPVNVLLGTLGSGLDWKQKVFMAWIAPRGIVAAAVASLFAAREGFDGGDEMRALVFLVIAITVLSAGLLGGPLASLLGIRRRQDAGWVILGAHELARALARALRDRGQEVVCLDSSTEAVTAAEVEGLKVLWGNALEERTLHRAEIDTRRGAIGVTPNGKLNLLFLQRAREEGRPRNLFLAMKPTDQSVAADMIETLGAEILFGRPEDVEMWDVRLRRKLAEIQTWRLSVDPEAEGPHLLGDETAGLLVALAFTRDETTSPVTGSVRFQKGDQVTAVVNGERKGDLPEVLRRLGWVGVEEQEPAA
jgi:NhaP-type Na+/H+ or K+/H+ antiporter